MGLLPRPHRVSTFPVVATSSNSAPRHAKDKKGAIIGRYASLDDGVNLIYALRRLTDMQVVWIQQWTALPVIMEGQENDGRAPGGRLLLGQVPVDPSANQQISEKDGYSASRKSPSILRIVNVSPSHVRGVVLSERGPRALTVRVPSARSNPSAPGSSQRPTCQHFRTVRNTQCRGACAVGTVRHVRSGRSITGVSITIKESTCAASGFPTSSVRSGIFSSLSSSAGFSFFCRSAIDERVLLQYISAAVCHSIPISNSSGPSVCPIPGRSSTATGRRQSGPNTFHGPTLSYESWPTLHVLWWKLWAHGRATAGCSRSCRIVSITIHPTTRRSIHARVLSAAGWRGQ